jgi:hypothetical protein
MTAQHLARRGWLPRHPCLATPGCLALAISAAASAAFPSGNE